MITNIETLTQTLMAPGKGILAADESEKTMKSRLELINVPNTEENGRRFRNLLFTAPDLDKYISGVILHDATMRHKSDGGVFFPHLLESKGIIPGIKVDAGVELFPNFPNEEISHGLDGLRVRLREYYELGARFTKWRSVIRISDTTPNDVVLHANAQVLAHYAGIVQEHHMVPIVEPEVLYDGTHTLEKSRDVIERTLSILFDTLKAFKVSLPGLILKTSMALPGKEAGLPLVPQAVALETMRALKNTVPENIGGIVFLSGGQSPVEATANLNAIMSMGKLPWPVSFSYSRAVEEPVLEAWQGEDARVHEAQRAFLHRLSLNVSARKGAYKKEME